MEVVLVDGTYELFRIYYALPSAKDVDGREVAAVRGVVQSVLAMITGGARHIGVATDHVIESFRNDLWPGYKTGAGIEPDLYAQFPLLEEGARGGGSRRLADGRVRSRRCPGLGGGDRGARSAR
jgi:5'-3' exonuclease